MTTSMERRAFLAAAAVGAPAVALGQAPNIAGFEKEQTDPNVAPVWHPFSDRKLRVGIAGYGVCQFGAAFYFQDHPNVEVAAVTDLVPERCEALAKVCRCQKTYPSAEEMIKDDTLEAVFIATDAPSHARLAIAALEAGKHVASAVPAVFGSLDEAAALYDAVLRSGRRYMLFETSTFHEDLTAMRALYTAGALGQMVYSEGEYYHYMPTPIDSWQGWRIGLPPQYYPTHSNAYYNCLAGGWYTDVCCQGRPSVIDHLKPENNVYKNPFGTEVALFRTDDGGTARMAVSWDTPGFEGEKGRLRFQKATYEDRLSMEVPAGIDVRRPALPPGVEAGSHGGSHGHLCEEFVRAVLTDRDPLVNIAWALNLTVSGIVAHQSALKDGERLKIPVYHWPPLPA